MRRFLPLAGACGLEGFWAWACARDSRDARVRAFVQGGRSASQAKAQGTSPGASFLSPLSLAIQRKGARGRRGAQPPRLKLGIPCVTHYGLGKTHLSDAALLGRALATPGPSPTKDATANLAE